jgi:HEAT repeat protein
MRERKLYLMVGFLIGFFLFFSLAEEEIKMEAGKGEVSSPLERLKSTDWKERMIAVEELKDKKYLPELLKLLKDESKWVREAAVTALGEIKDKETIPYLSMVLGEEKIWFVRQAAVYALGKTGAEEALPYLKKSLYDSHLGVQKAAIEALGEIKLDQTVDILLEKLSSLKEEEKNLKGTIILALGKVGTRKASSSLKKIFADDPNWFEAVLESEGIERVEGKKDFPLLEEVLGRHRQKELVIIAEHKKTFYELLEDLKSPNEKEKIKAITLLGEMEREEAVEPLKVLLKEKSAWVRKAAVTALGKFRKKELVPVLIECLKDRVWLVRVSTIEALKNHQDEEIIPHLLRILRKDESEAVRKSSAEALGKFKQRKVVDQLIRSLKKDRDPGVRKSAALSLGEIKDKKCERQLIKSFLKDRDLEVRIAAGKALGKVKSTKAISHLLKSFKKDKELSIRIAAVEALGMIGEKKVVKDLIAFLKTNQDGLLLTKVIWALGEIRSEEAVPLLIVILQQESKREEKRVDINEVAAALIKIGRPVVPYMVRALEIENIPKAKEILRKIYQKAMEEKKDGR